MYKGSKSHDKDKNPDNSCSGFLEKKKRVEELKTDKSIDLKILDRVVSFLIPTAHKENCSREEVISLTSHCLRQNLD